MPATDELVRRRAPEIARAIQAAASGSPLEADFPTHRQLEGFWTTKGTKGRERREKEGSAFVIFACFRGFRDPNAP